MQVAGDGLVLGVRVVVGEALAREREDTAGDGVLRDVRLERLAEHVDFILIDTPPAAESADAQTVAARARAALFVARKHHSRLWRLQAISQSVARTRTTVLGAVLNDF